ncbi:hypothetical protein BU15DRAFT_73187 [Melanogaster broomeanus]|nr:hypothetical protein BU15DRAFT_73187 [Melanogaster broomeanus]
MTRITNFGRKRNYVEAGFASEPFSTSNQHPTCEPKSVNDVSPSTQGDSTPAKKKRKRTKKPKAVVDDERQPGDSKPAGETSGGGKGEGPSSIPKQANKTNKDRRPRVSVAVKGFAKRTEQRRLKRATGREADTVCFACREKGHAARDCPNAAGEGGHENGQKNMNKVVGMCYRCGSTKHTLSRCKNPEDLHNPSPSPHVSCVLEKVISLHHAHKTKKKGYILMEGVKDNSGTAAGTVFGTGNGAGADEDDFHTFKRKNAEVSKGEKEEERQRKRLDVKAGLHTGTVKAFGTRPGV